MGATGIRKSRRLPINGYIVHEYLRRCEGYDLIAGDIPLLPTLDDKWRINTVGIDVSRGRGVICDICLVTPGDPRYVRNSEQDVLQYLKTQWGHVREFVKRRTCVLERGFRFQVWSSVLPRGFKTKLLRASAGLPIPLDIIAEEEYAKRFWKLREGVARDSKLWRDMTLR